MFRVILSLALLPAVFLAATHLASAQDKPLDTLITIDDKEIRCRVLRMTDGLFIVRLGKGVLSFPVSKVKGVYMEGKRPYGEVQISSATTSLEITLNRRPVEIVALSPLEILDASSVRRRSRERYWGDEYIRGHLNHEFEHTLREIKVSLSFYNKDGLFLGEESESYFNIKKDNILPFVLDLTRPFGQSPIAKIVASVGSIQSRFQKQLNYQRQ